MFGTELFWKQLQCMEEVLVTLLGLFGALHSHSEPGELRPRT